MQNSFVQIPNEKYNREGMDSKANIRIVQMQNGNICCFAFVFLYIKYFLSSVAS